MLVRVSLLLLTLATLAGCSSPPPRTGPAAPVERRGDPVATGRSPGAPAPSEPDIAAYVPPRQPQPVRPEPAKAVQVLMARAEDQRRAGDHGAAAGSLERALRIEPRNARLWHRLAQVRADQGRYAMAEELAGKSNSLAGLYDRDLKRDNWALIAQVRRAQGLAVGAREAERRASEFD